MPPRLGRQDAAAERTEGEVSMNVRKFRKAEARNIRLRPYDRRVTDEPDAERRRSNGLLPSTMYVPLYVTPSSTEWTGR